MTFYQLRAINSDGSSPAGGGLLPDFEKLSIGIIFSDVGSLTFDYATGGLNSGLVTEQREIAVYDHLGEIPDGRFVIESSNGQRWDTGTGTLYRSWTARSWWKVFEEALVYGVSWPTNKTEDTVAFSTKTPGAILKSVVDKAQSLGEMSGLTYTFTNTLDSAGVAWAGTTTMDVKTDTTILNLITSMVENGLVEIRMVGRELRAYNPDGLGTDRTVGSTPLSLWSMNSIELPEQRDSRGLRTVAIVRGDDGACVEVVNAGAVATWGRRPLVISQAGVVDAGALTAIGTAALAQSAQVRSERSVKYPIALGSTPIPLRDYIPGDWVFNDMSGTPDRVRVRQLTIEQDATEAAPTVVATLNDLFLEAEIALARQISGITGGARLDSTPPAQGPITVVATPDTLAPAQVLGLTGTSTAYVDGQSRTWTFATLNWNAVTTNADTSSITDLDRYEVFLKKQADATFNQALSTLNTSAIVDGLLPNTTYNFQVRALDRNGNAGALSVIFTLTTANDTTAPPVPKTPVVQDYLGQIRIYWDGLGSLGEAMPGDFNWTEVHISTSSGFTPSSATLIDQLSGPGYSVMIDLVYDTPYFVKLVSVDRLGNKSAASAQATATPTRVSGLDVAALAIATSQLGDGAVTALKIADATITSAKIGTAQILNANIANAAIDDAKIASVSAGKITVGTLLADVTLSARIKTANSGARVELNSGGLQAFNTAGTQTVDVAAATGSVTILGSFRTGTAGGGTAFVTMDDSVDRSNIRFWESTGSRFAYINSPPGTAGQVTIAMNTGNFDLATGNLAGGTQGFARLYMNQAWTQLARVTSAQVPHGGEIYLDHSQVLLGVRRNGVANKAGTLELTSNYAAIGFTSATGAIQDGIYFTEATGCFTAGSFGNSIGWSASPVGGWSITNFSLNKWGPFVILNTTVTRTGAAVAAGPHAANLVDITATGAFNTSFVAGVTVGSNTNSGYATVNGSGLLQLNYLAAPLASGGAIRCTGIWWV